MLNCIDNSGAAVVECIQVMRKKRKAARIGTCGGQVEAGMLGLNNILGDRIIVVVQKQRSFGETSPGSSGLSIANKVRRGDMRHAVVVRARKEMQRADGSVIKFDDNACVLINKSGDPIGTRLTSEPNLSGSGNSLLTSLRCRGLRTTAKAMVQNPITRTNACIIKIDL